MRIIQADFNSRDEAGNVWLTLPCSQRDIAKMVPVLQAGDRVVLTDGEGFVTAVIIGTAGDWAATADWDTWEEPALADQPVVVGQSRPVRRLAA